MEALVVDMVVDREVTLGVSMAVDPKVGGGGNKGGGIGGGYEGRRWTGRWFRCCLWVWVTSINNYNTKHVIKTIFNINLLFYYNAYTVYCYLKYI